MRRTAVKISEALNMVSRRCQDESLGCIDVFLCIAANNGICIKDIVHMCGLSEAKVSRSVDALELAGDNGLVHVRRHPTDGRKRLVFLTDEGRILLADMDRLFAA